MQHRARVNCYACMRALGRSGLRLIAHPNSPAAVQPSPAQSNPVLRTFLLQPVSSFTKAATSMHQMHRAHASPLTPDPLMPAHARVANPKGAPSARPLLAGPRPALPSGGQQPPCHIDARCPTARSACAYVVRAAPPPSTSHAPAHTSAMSTAHGLETNRDTAAAYLPQRPLKPHHTSAPGTLWATSVCPRDIHPQATTVTAVFLAGLICSGLHGNTAHPAPSVVDTYTPMPAQEAPASIKHSHHPPRSMRPSLIHTAHAFFATEREQPVGAFFSSPSIARSGFFFRDVAVIGTFLCACL